MSYSIHIYIYIYIERERERDLYIYIYIYIYSLASRRGQDKRLLVYRSATNPMTFGICCLSAHTLPQIWLHFAIVCNVMSYIATWKLWYFCDDPVCPDPVWKLSSLQAPRTGRWLDKGLLSKRRPVSGKGH